MSAVKYVARTLYVKWRELLTMRLHSSYFRNSAYYKLNVLQDRLDNMWVWLCKCKGNLIRWFYHSGTSHQGLGRQNRQMGPWPLTFKSRGPFRKSMGHWSHGVGRMIGNKEMIGTIRGSSTVFFCWCQIMFCIPRSWHFFFLRYLRQILQNVASFSYTSYGHKVSHFCWNFLFSFILAVAGLESVEVVLVSSHLSVISVLSILQPILSYESLLCPWPSNFGTFFGGIIMKSKWILIHFAVKMTKTKVKHMSWLDRTSFGS